MRWAIVKEEGGLIAADLSVGIDGREVGRGVSNLW
jgi:hypothetical protein